MTDTNLTLVLYGKGDLRLEDRPIPEPKDGEVQVAMQQVGICGSDIHFWADGRLSTMVLDGNPVALGHEGSAIVTKLGPGVTKFKIGDRVAIEPALPCGNCKYCYGSRYNLCPDVKGLAAPGNDGHITRFFAYSARFCHKLPDNVSTEEGALIEPLAVAVHATNRAGVKMDDAVAILGAGPIGLLCMLTCKARGTRAVCITDVNESRLEFAKKLGADITINVANKKPKEIAAEIAQKMDGQPDIVIECSGVVACTHTALHAARPGGVAMFVGMGPAYQELPIGDAMTREVDIRGIFRYVDCFPPAINLVATGKVDVKPLISHRFEIKDAIQAFETAKQGKGIKVVINCRKP